MAPFVLARLYFVEPVGMNKKPIFALAVLGLLAVSTERLAAQEDGDPQRGRVLAREVCAECHAVEPGRPSPNPNAPTFEAIASVRGMSIRALTVALLTPHRTMPNLVLEADELRNVATYILTLKRN
jgi:mono/diheme cytochrome c family protein